MVFTRGEVQFALDPQSLLQQFSRLVLDTTPQLRGTNGELLLGTEAGDFEQDALGTSTMCVLGEVPGLGDASSTRLRAQLVNSAKGDPVDSEVLEAHGYGPGEGRELLVSSAHRSINDAEQQLELIKERANKMGLLVHPGGNGPTKKPKL